MESGKERKVCFIASSGGHWEELMCLKSVAQKYDTFYVTEEGGQANDASANLDKIYTFPQINRYESGFATVYKGNIIKNLIMDCQSYTKYRPNETTGGIFVSWRRKEELPTGA